MRRRHFIITLLGGATIALPFAARAQQPSGMRRVGMLMNFGPDEPEGRSREEAFVQGLQNLGWRNGGNLQIDTRWAANDAELYRRYSAELVALAPDVILAGGSPSLAALQKVSRSVPLVFANVIDPVGAGFVASPRPGGNTTGFSLFEYSISGKWLELLHQVAPNVTRIAVLRDTSLAAGIGQFAAIQAMAPPPLGVELTPIDMDDASVIRRTLTAFASEPNGGLIVTVSPLAVTHRDLIISLAMQLLLPNVYAFRYYPVGGGLASYGPDPNDDFRRAASYVNRILNGEKPGSLPVQAPTRYEVVLNLKTAKALGLNVPSTLLATADDVIE
jgi:putative tryptophan/tyrosine transport system substrate-binding protein